MPQVAIDNVHKSFGDVEVLKGVTVEVPRGKVFALIGRSGSGKSTLLRCINGLEAFQKGSITVCGLPVTTDAAAQRRLREKVGIVFQSYNLFPHLTIGENVMLAPRIVQKRPRGEVLETAREVLLKVGLIDKFDSYPDELSGGQQQRAAIARSLAMKPEVMLFDEVTSALDPELTGEVLGVMEDLARGGMTMVVVTHEMGFARRVANSVVFMHEGKVHETGPARETLNHPQTAELRKFLEADVK